MSESPRSRGTIPHLFVNPSTMGVTALVGAVAQQTVGIHSMILTAQGAVSVTIQDTGSNALSQTFVFGSNGGSVTVDRNANGDPWWISGNGLGVQVNLSAGVQCGLDIWYLQSV